ncbi:restriction endonuclease subunit S, partial [Bacillus sp. Xin]|nr:restriction endonuclease subunit S [Bacillus sp. Xin]
RDGIAASNIKKMKLPVPPYKEQIEISKFLDSEVIKLDKIIADAQKSLEILQETRKSIIFETVTRGLKKDRELKDSGIAWIGEIPSEWLLKKLDYMSISYSGGTPDRDNFSY